MTNEEFYRTRLAPMLMDLARQCRERGMAFAALADYGESGVGRTYTLPDGAPSVIRYACDLASCTPDGAPANIDGLMQVVMADARRTGHNSVILRQLGVPPRGVAEGSPEELGLTDVHLRLLEQLQGKERLGIHPMWAVRAITEMTELGLVEFDTSEKPDGLGGPGHGFASLKPAGAEALERWKTPTGPVPATV